MKLGLVLGGGGGKGSYQIGVFKALEELGIAKHIQVISGTSVGALNAMLFLQQDLDLAIGAWEGLSQDKILPLNKKDIIMQSKLKFFNTSAKINKLLDLKPDLLYEGRFSREGIVELIDKLLDAKKILNSPITCYCTCCDLMTKDKRYFRIQDYNAETMKNILLASSAIPGIYDAVDINGNLYLDGGLKDNLPIWPVYNEGCDIIIVVRLGAEDVIDYKKFPGVQIIDIALQQSEVGILKDGTLNFSKGFTREKIKDGYMATMNLINPIFTLKQNIVEIENQQKTVGVMKKIKGLFSK